VDPRVEDYDAWLRDAGELRTLTADLLLGADPFVGQWFSKATLEELWSAHQQRRWDGAELLGRLLTLEMFHREVLGGARRLPAMSGRV
jgi:hypothetical protein